MNVAKPLHGRRNQADLFDVVLGDQVGAKPKKRWHVHSIAWALAIALHLLLLFAANRTEPSLEIWSAQMAAMIHEDLASQAPVAIEAAPPPEPEPEPEPAPKPKKVVAPAPKVVEPEATSPSPTPVGEPAPPAESGQIVAAEETAPVDFTDNTFVAGNGKAYVGGASASDGTNKVAVPAGAVDRNAKPNANPGRRSKARSIQLSGNEWRCDWPEAAMEQDIYEQFVILKVIVNSDGTVEKAWALSDPGNGFGAAAEACARRTKFSAAKDASGRAISATSPPIRVRFTR